MEDELFTRDGFGVDEVNDATGEIKREGNGGVHGGGLGAEEEGLKGEVVLNQCDAADCDRGWASGTESDRG